MMAIRGSFSQFALNIIIRRDAVICADVLNAKAKALLNDKDYKHINKCQSEFSPHFRQIFLDKLFFNQRNWLAQAY